MRSWGVALAALALLAPPLGAQAKPQILVVGDSSRLELPPAMWAAIRRVDASFRPYQDSDFLPMLQAGFRPTATRTLYAVVGDFNADGRLDAAVYGQGHQRERLLGVVSSGRSGYQAHVLSAAPATPPHARRYNVAPGHDEFGLARYLQVWGPGRLVTAVVPDTLELQAVAVELHLAETGGELFYWRDGTFHTFGLGD